MNFKDLSTQILHLDENIHHVQIVDDDKLKTIAEKTKNKLSLKEISSRSSDDSVCILRYMSSKESISNISVIGKNKQNQLIFYTENFIIYVSVKKNTKKPQLMKIADDIEDLIKRS